jgi:hypothetical protein
MDDTSTATTPQTIPTADPDLLRIYQEQRDMLARFQAQRAAGQHQDIRPESGRTWQRPVTSHRLGDQR